MRVCEDISLDSVKTIESNISDEESIELLMELRAFQGEFFLFQNRITVLPAERVFDFGKMFFFLSSQYRYYTP